MYGYRLGPINFYRERLLDTNPARGIPPPSFQTRESVFSELLYALPDVVVMSRFRELLIPAFNLSQMTDH